MKKDNLIQQKSFDLALSVINVYKKLNLQKEFVLANQILKSGTSVGANVEEAIGAQSKKDFLITIAYKEARETKYWLRLLHQSGYLSGPGTMDLIEQCEEVLRVLGSIQKTIKQNLGFSAHTQK